MQRDGAPQLRGVDLKAERVRAGLTQRELGQRIGVSGRRIANVEKEYRPAPTVVRRILAALAAGRAMSGRIDPPADSRVVRIDDLPLSVREAILALIAIDESAKKADPDTLPQVPTPPEKPSGWTHKARPPAALSRVRPTVSKEVPSVQSSKPPEQYLPHLRRAHGPAIASLPAMLSSRASSRADLPALGLGLPHRRDRPRAGGVVMTNHESGFGLRFPGVLVGHDDPDPDPDRRQPTLDSIPGRLNEMESAANAVRAAVEGLVEALRLDGVRLGDDEALVEAYLFERVADSVERSTARLVDQAHWIGDAVEEWRSERPA